jgi:hypothetical protein
MKVARLFLAAVALVACSNGKPFADPTPSDAPCGAEAVTFKPQTEGATGSSVVYLEITHSGSACRFSGQAKLTIVDEDGKPLDVEGNPSTQQIARDLPLDAQGISWIWRNWCGDDVPITFVFEVAGERVELDARTGARCEEPGGSSSLSAID